MHKSIQGVFVHLGLLEDEAVAHQEVDDGAGCDRQYVREEVVQVGCANERTHKQNVADDGEDAGSQVELDEPKPRVRIGPVRPREALVPKVVVNDCRFDGEGRGEQIVHLHSGLQNSKGDELNYNAPRSDRVEFQPAKDGCRPRLRDGVVMVRFDHRQLRHKIRSS